LLGHPDVTRFEGRIELDVASEEAPPPLAVGEGPAVQQVEQSLDLAGAQYAESRVRHGDDSAMRKAPPA